MTVTIVDKKIWDKFILPKNCMVIQQQENKYFSRNCQCYDFIASTHHWLKTANLGKQNLVFRNIPSVGHVLEGREIITCINTTRIRAKKGFVSGLVFSLMRHIFMCVYECVLPRSAKNHKNFFILFYLKYYYRQSVVVWSEP